MATPLSPQETPWNSNWKPCRDLYTAYEKSLLSRVTDGHCKDNCTSPQEKC